MVRFIVALGIALSASGAFAQNLTFQQLDENDLKDVVKDFSAVFNHSSVSGASSLGTIFGFEVGLMGGITNTKRINDLASQSGTNANASRIPHGELLGMITVPAGVTIEGGFIPKVGKDSFKFNTFTLGVKWTPTDVFLDLPVSLAIKGHVTRTNAEFNQDIQTIPTKFDYTNTITALTLLVSKSFVIVEPYFGLQFLHAKGDLDVTGTAPVFDTTYTTGTSASAQVSSTGFLAGAELKLLVVKLGAEYQNLFGTSRYSGKLSFYF